METLLMKKFATDPPRRDELGFADSIFQVALQFDLKDPIPEQKTD
jgi:hypothetical protein